MRCEQEILDLILHVAQSDERIRTVFLVGSRANEAVQKDCYQDFDIIYFVSEISPFYNNPVWVETKFGEPLIMQMPETMRNPIGDGNFNYMMIYPDGIRIDLSFRVIDHVCVNEPAIVLLNKDENHDFITHQLVRTDEVYHIVKPSPLEYYSCCNNFWWCLNNVAKGIARDELPYVMNMLNQVVRMELHDMMNYYIGIQYNFSISTGKDGKYFKKYLSSELYAQYAATYPSSDYLDIWNAIEIMSDLFHFLAMEVAVSLDFIYRFNEERGIRRYLQMVKDSIR